MAKQTMTARERARRKQQEEQTIGQARAIEDAGQTPRRLKITLGFENGRTQEVKIKLFLLGQAEIEYPGSRILQAMFAAYLQLGEPGGDFEAWAHTLEYATPVEEEIPLGSSNGHGSE